MNYKAPAELSEQSKAIWRGVVPRRAKAAERLLLIKTALQALDRANEVSAEIETQGLTIENPSSGAIRANPLIKLEKELRQQFAGLWNNLNLDFDYVIDGNQNPDSTYFPNEEKRIAAEKQYSENIAANDAAVKEFLQVADDA